MLTLPEKLLPFRINFLYHDSGFAAILNDGLIFRESGSRDFFHPGIRSITPRERNRTGLNGGPTITRGCRKTPVGLMAGLTLSIPPTAREVGRGAGSGRLRPAGIHQDHAGFGLRLPTYGFLPLIEAVPEDFRRKDSCSS